jgi:hypothetical protein
LLGAKPEAADFRVNFSQWDVLAMAEVQREGYRHSSSTHFDIHDVLLHDKLADAKQARQRSPWIGHFDERGPAVVCFGSTRALHATELMLSSMFNAQPFDPAKRDKVPVHFVWPADLPNVLPSSFHLSAKEAGLPPGARALAVRHGGQTQVFADTFTPRAGGVTYGLLVVQRRGSGKLWICLAGVTGLGTLAAAPTRTEVRLH